MSSEATSFDGAKSERRNVNYEIAKNINFNHIHPSPSIRHLLYNHQAPSLPFLEGSYQFWGSGKKPFWRFCFGGWDQLEFFFSIKYFFMNSFIVSRNNGVPPAPPTLGITSTTGSAISLGWTPAPDGGAPLIAYHVHYHREFGDWDRVDVSPRNTSFTLTGLRCGTNYQFYLQVKP